jgi:menaquinone-dependent protoporphyrinogen IX oxidase
MKHKWSKVQKASYKAGMKEGKHEKEIEIKDWEKVKKTAKKELKRERAKG